MNESLEQNIIASARTALIDADSLSDRSFRPRFVYNDYSEGRKVVAELESELRSCSAFSFSVAFVTKSGIVPLLQTLKELETRGVPGRILTTDYLSFSDPDALVQLDSFSNIKVRLYRTAGVPGRHGFHTKGYIFDQENGSQRVLVGSSNMTANALTVNKEWNLSFTSLKQGELVREISDEFERLWALADDLDGVVDTYRQLFAEKRETLRQQSISTFDQVVLKPNNMQVSFIHRLDSLIREGNTRALLISATGTGKTLASAFVLRHIKAERVLFLAHREQILRQSIKSYGRVFGCTKTFGLLSGNSHERDRDYLFATMQTMSKPDVLRSFDPHEFDCIVVDEVHRAGAESYQRILDYFVPRFCLGMTASPDRPDGFDVYGLFNNVIAYEIRLQQAMEEELLCPFHYFGITDFQVDGSSVDDLSDFSRLVSGERIDYVLEQAEYYGFSGSRVKGLVFCSRRSEGEALAKGFAKRGYDAQFVSGDDPFNVRQAAIDRLVADPGEPCYGQKLDYLITVDIFNEGVDIPEVNQVLMLRPTQSPIVFVQQLGRGLRKSADKEYVVVIDFIGNYRNNYMIPIALSGDRSYNKDTIRKFVMEGDRIVPGCSSIHFDEISRRRIFESIDASKVSLRFLKEKYVALKNKLGRVPLMRDFWELGEVDPVLFIDSRKSYYRFLAQQEPEWADELTEDEQLILEYVSRYFGNGMRPHELLMVKQLIESGVSSRSRLEYSLAEYGVRSLSDITYRSACSVVGKTFVNSPSDKRAYGDFELIDFDALDGSGVVDCSSFLSSSLKKDAFKAALQDLVEFGLARYRDKYRSRDVFALYEKYSRKDVCRLLDWDQDNSSTMYGYRIKHDTCPIFVTYNKGDDISESTRYADEFLNPFVFSWMTRSRLTLESREVKELARAHESGLDVRLFVKKSDSEGSDFYYFGRVRPTDPVQTTQLDDKGNPLPIVNFKLELDNPARDDIYEYFVGTSENTIVLSG